MVVPDELKLNKFREVQLPSPADFAQRYGQVVTPDSQYTGDDVIKASNNKIDNILEMEAYDAQMQKEESSKSE